MCKPGDTSERCRTATWSKTGDDLNGSTTFSTTTTSSTSFLDVGGDGIGGIDEGNAHNAKDMLSSIMAGLSGISGGGFAKEGTDNMASSIQQGLMGGKNSNVQDSFTSFGGVNDIMGGSSSQRKSSFGFKPPTMPKPSFGGSFGGYSSNSYGGYSNPFNNNNSYGSSYGGYNSYGSNPYSSNSYGRNSYGGSYGGYGGW